MPKIFPPIFFYNLQTFKWYKYRIMKITDIIEARRNPPANPKVDLLSAVNQAMEGGDTENTFVSFTDIEKLGINPASKYATPIGIYSYPVKYVARYMKSGNRAGDSLPFAGDSPWVNIFKVTGNVINLDTMSDAYLSVWQRLAERLLKDRIKFAKEWVTDTEKRSHTESNVTGKFGGRFWFLTRELAIMLVSLDGKTNADSDDYDDVLKNRRRVAGVWNWIFRQMGIDGAVDLGNGIIHGNEPTQAVFFSSSVIKNNRRIANKYAPRDVETSKREGEIAHDMISTYSALGADERMEFVKNIESVSSLPVQVWKSIFTNRKNTPDIRKYIIDSVPELAAKMPLSHSEYVYLLNKNTIYIHYVANALMLGEITKFPIDALLEVVRKRPEYAGAALEANVFMGKKIYPDTAIVELLKFSPQSYSKITNPTADMLKAAVIGAELKMNDQTLLARARDSWISFHDSLYAEGQNKGIFPRD